MMVSLHVQDAPIGYDPPFGPSVEVRVGYDDRETLQPANLNYINFLGGNGPIIRWQKSFGEQPSLSRCY
jgi:hypothetical protein